MLINGWGPHVLHKDHTSHKISFPEVFPAVLRNNFGRNGLKYFSGALYINVWASIIQMFRLTERTQVPTKPEKRGSTVFV